MSKKTARFLQGLDSCYFPSKKVTVIADPNRYHESLLYEFDSRANKTIIAANGELPEYKYMPYTSSKQSGKYSFRVNAANESIALCYNLAENMIEDLFLETLGDVSMYQNVRIADDKTGKELEISEDEFEALIDIRMNTFRDMQDALALMLTRRISLHFRTNNVLDVDSFMAFVGRDIAKDLREQLQKAVDDDELFILDRITSARFTDEPEFLIDLLVHLSDLRDTDYSVYTDDGVLYLWTNSDGGLMFGTKGRIGFEGDIIESCMDTFDGTTIMLDILGDDYGLASYIITAALPTSVVIHGNDKEMEKYIRENNAFFHLESIRVVDEKKPVWYDDNRDYILSHRKEILEVMEQYIAESIIGVSVDEMYDAMADNVSPLELYFQTLDENG